MKIDNQAKSESTHESEKEPSLEFKNDGISREWMDLLDGSKVPVVSKLELSDGRTVRIAEGKGSHAMEAQEDAADTATGKFNMKKYTASLMSALVTIDEKFLGPDDFTNMRMKDYNKISLEFMNVNF